MKAIKNTVFVKEEKTDSKVGSIDMSASKENMPRQGTVTAIGKLVDEIAVGDKVIFSSMAGTTINVDGEEVLLMRDQDILAIL
jgi:chaperonin GroES